MKNFTITQKRKKLINFMNWKDRKLFEEGYIKRHEYFNKKDKLALETISWQKIKKMYNGIEIDNDKYAGDITICPFCIIWYDTYPDCVGCLYHNRCFLQGSTYRKVDPIVNNLGKKEILSYLNRYFWK